MKTLNIKSTMPFITAMLMMAACTKGQNTDQTQEQSQLEYSAHVRDSVLNARGAEQMRTTERDLRSKQREMEYERDSLKKSTYATQMEREVSAAVDTILTQTNQKIKDYLRLYPDTKLQDRYNLSDDITCITTESSEYPHIFKYNSIDISGLSNYGDEQRTQIINHVKKLLNDANNMAYTVAQNIIKKYAKYYPGADIEKYIPAEYREYFDQKSALIQSEGEGDMCFGAGDIRNYRYLGVYRTVEVYDSKLNPEFFADNTCKYELINVAPNKWQVVKTHTNGKTERTHVFSDNKNWQTQTSYYQEFNPAEKTEISFQAGKNMGVRITAKEVLFQCKPEIENDTLPDPNNARANKIKQLNKSIENAEKRQRELWEKLDSIEHLADSVANKMTQERFQNQR